MNELWLYRGVTVKHDRELKHNGLGIANPRPAIGEVGWPPGLSFALRDAFEIAQARADLYGGTPVCGRILVSEVMLQWLQLIGIQRVTEPNVELPMGSILWWLCVDWREVEKASEFTIPKRNLEPRRLNQLRAEVKTTGDGDYVAYKQFVKGLGRF